MKSFGEARSASREAAMPNSSSSAGTRLVQPPLVVNVVGLQSPQTQLPFQQPDACIASGDTVDPRPLTFWAIVDIHK